MTTTGTISVIVPTYNQRDSVVYSVNSILNQTYPVLEVILVDDGSSDETGVMVERQKNDSRDWRERVRYIYQPNQGQSAANNSGIAQARGEWIAFNASDDLWLPTKLELQMRALQKFGTKYGFCFSDAWFINNPHMKSSIFESAGKTTPNTFGTVANPSRLIALGKHPIWMQTAIARADVVRQIGGWDSNLRYFDDYDLIFRFSRATAFCFVGIPLVLIDRSPVEESAFGHARDWHKEEFRLRMEQKCLEKHFMSNDALPNDLRAIFRRNLHNVHKAWANLYIENGDFLRAQESLATAATYGASAMQIAKSVGVRFVPSLLRSTVTRDRRKLVRHDQLRHLADQNVGVM